MNELTIASVMTPAPLAVSEDDPLATARALMVRHRVHHLPVVSRDEVVGILTDRDMYLVSYLANDLLNEDDLVAGDACVRHPYTCGPATPLADALTEMATRRIGSALVVSNRHLVGIFTAHDACAHLARALRQAESVMV